jgi:hypothetical protein
MLPARMENDRGWLTGVPVVNPETVKSYIPGSETWTFLMEKFQTNVDPEKEPNPGPAYPQDHLGWCRKAPG